MTTICVPQVSKEELADQGAEWGGIGDCCSGVVTDGEGGTGGVFEVDETEDRDDEVGEDEAVGAFDEMSRFVDESAYSWLMRRLVCGAFLLFTLVPVLTLLLLVVVHFEGVWMLDVVI
jgi:hypothetical protein